MYHKEPHRTNEKLKVRLRTQGFKHRPVRPRTPPMCTQTPGNLEGSVPQPTSGSVGRCNLSAQGSLSCLLLLYDSYEPLKPRGAAALSGCDWPPSGALGPSVGQRPHRQNQPEENFGRQYEGRVFKNGQDAAGGTLLAAFTQLLSRSSERGWD